MRLRLGAIISLLALPACQSPKPQEPPKQGGAAPVASPAQAGNSATPPAAQSEAVNNPPPETHLSVEQARTILQSAKKTFSLDPNAWLELALFEFKANNPAEGEKLLKEMRQRFPTYARAPYHLGMFYYARRRLIDATEALDRAAKLAPDDAVVLNNAGIAQLAAGDDGAARRYGEQAVKADPQYAEAYLLLARASDHPGTAQQAIDAANQFVQYAAEPSAGYYLMGRIYARQARKDKAEEALLKARDADPKNPKIWLLLGRVYYELFHAAKEDEGVQCLQKALELDPNQWEAHQWLGKIYSGKSQWEEAVDQLQQALRLSPDPDSLYYELGQALLKSGKFAEGQKMLQRHQDYQDFTRIMGQLTASVTKEPKNRGLRYDMARLCLKYHQGRGAITLLNEAEHQLGTDATFQALRRQAEADMSATSAAPVPAPGAGRFP